MLPLLRFRFIWVATLGIAASGVLAAKNYNLDSQQSWVSGISLQVDASNRYGSLCLAAENSLASDAFEMPFLKLFWTPTKQTVYNAVPGNMDVQSSGLVGDLGLRSAFLATSIDGTFLVNIKPKAINQSGTLFLAGQPWDASYFGLAVTWKEPNILYSALSSFGGISPTVATRQQSRQLATGNIKITKQGNTLNAYFSPASNSWTLITSTVMVLSPANYSVGLGAVHPDYAGLAEYRNFQVLPYAATGTWTSAPIDLGGKPLKAGRVDWVANVPVGTALQVQCASANDSSNWSNFSGDLNNGGSFSAPLARYVKFRVNLQANVARDLSPELDKITLTQDDLETDLLKAENVKFVPNPGRGDKVTLFYGLGQKPQKVTLEVYSPAGRQLWQKDVSAGLGQNSFDLDASGMASGSYFMRILAWSQEGGQPVIVTKPFALLR